MSEGISQFFYDKEEGESNSKIFFRLPRKKIRELCSSLDMISFIEKEFYLLDLTQNQREILKDFVDELKRESEELSASLDGEDVIDLRAREIVEKWEAEA